MKIPQQAKNDFFTETLAGRGVFLFMERGNQWKGLGELFDRAVKENGAFGEVVKIEGDEVTVKVDPKLLV